MRSLARHKYLNFNKFKKYSYEGNRILCYFYFYSQYLKEKERELFIAASKTLNEIVGMNVCLSDKTCKGS